METGDELQTSFDVTAAPDTPDGTPVVVNYSIASEEYTNQKSFSVVIGEVPVFVMQNGSATLCAAKFYDTGGHDGEYQDNEDLTFTFYPGDRKCQD